MRVIRTLILTAALALASSAWSEENTFDDNGDGTIIDTKTGLMWQEQEDGRRIWNDSLEYCKGLSLAAHSDWRLPTLEELESLWDDAGSKPDIRKQYFPSMKISGEPDQLLGTIAPYWSSTIVKIGAANGVGFLDFANGQIQAATQNMALPFYARCVRLGSAEL